MKNLKILFRNSTIFEKKWIFEVENLDLCSESLAQMAKNDHQLGPWDDHCEICMQWSVRVDEIKLSQRCPQAKIEKSTFLENGDGSAQKKKIGHGKSSKNSSDGHRSLHEGSRASAKLSQSSH